MHFLNLMSPPSVVIYSPFSPGSSNSECKYSFLSSVSNRIMQQRDHGRGNRGRQLWLACEVQACVSSACIRMSLYSIRVVVWCVSQRVDLYVHRNISEKKSVFVFRTEVCSVKNSVGHVRWLQECRSAVFISVLLISPIKLGTMVE
jgi:hypothetical protein